MRATMPEVIYGLWWTSDYAGDVPGDALMAADIDRDSKRFDRAGETTYDGVYMATRGSFVVREHQKPKSIATLEKKFGDRVSFGLCKSGENVGCWIDGKPHRLDMDRAYPDWTWNQDESAYLWAVEVYRANMSQTDLIETAVMNQCCDTTSGGDSMAAATLRTTFTATWHWFEIVSGIPGHPCEIETDDGESIDTPLFVAACEAAGVDSDPDRNLDAAVVRVTWIADRHEGIHVGDLLVTDGYGSDVTFLREPQAI